MSSLSARHGDRSSDSALDDLGLRTASALSARACKLHGTLCAEMLHRLDANKDGEGCERFC